MDASGRSTVIGPYVGTVSMILVDYLEISKKHGAKLPDVSSVGNETVYHAYHVYKTFKVSSEITTRGVTGA